MDDSPRLAPTLAPRWLRSLALLALALGIQGWQALALFGDNPLPRLLDNEPVVSGRHAVHLYHARVAATNWRAVGSPCCYDTALSAGYPRTAVVDGGARPFELFLLAPGIDSAAAYKVGLAATWWLLPCGYWLAARAVGLRSVTAATSAGLIVLLGGSAAGQKLLHEGELSAALLAMFAVLHLALLSRWHRVPCLFGWLGMLVTAAFGWFLQPVAWSGFALLTACCWAGMCRKHSPLWSAALALLQAAALAAIFPWLREWLRFWWIALPFAAGADSAPRDGWLPGALSLLSSNDRTACCLLIVGGCLGGCIRKVRHDRRPGLYLLTCGLLLLGAAAIALIWEPLALLGARHWATVGLAFLIVPAAIALTACGEWLVRGRGRPLLPYAIAGVLFCSVSAWLVRPSAVAELPHWGARPLQFGLSNDVKAFAGFLRDVSRPTARILWEVPESAVAAPSLILLPDLVGRDFLLPPDRDADVEYCFAHLANGYLAGRAIADWSDVDLEAFCRKYNVGWVVADANATAARFRGWPIAYEIAPPTGSRWKLFELKRPHSYILKGVARTYEADRQRVTLADVVPEEGEVVLSLHSAAGMRARPAIVRVEREPDPFDPVPMIRLRLPGPVARLTLTWELP